MNKVEKILSMMKKSPNNVRFSELSLVCKYYFGEPRNKGTSHHIYKTIWLGDPRVNIQKSKDGKAKPKPYQVKQILAAIDKLESIKNE